MDCAGKVDQQLQWRRPINTREPRQKVLIWARMRNGSQREDVRIVDLSGGGLCLFGANSLRRGEYVELSRGCHSIVGRVVWSDCQKLGLVAQEKIPLEALVNYPDRLVELQRDAVNARATLPHVKLQDGSRFIARAIQTSALALAGACAALLIGSLVQAAFARPMHSIAVALDGH